jgi:hypothetical protein
MQDEPSNLALTSPSAMMDPVITALIEALNETAEEDAEFPFCQFDLDTFHTA